MAETANPPVIPVDGPNLRVSVIIPTLNEAKNLPHVLPHLPSGLHEVILVDGRSTDGTVEAARELMPDIVVVKQTRRGKGNALACGFARASGDIIVMVDADGSTDVREIPRFVAPLLQGAEFAKGSRFCRGGRSHDITPVRRAGNWGLNTLVNVLFGTRFSDLCYGYNAFHRSALEVMDLPAIDQPAPADGSKVWGDGFEIETLINVRVARSGMVIDEVPSVEQPRIHGESNLNAVTDGLRVLRIIASERLRRNVSRNRVIELPEPRTAPAQVPAAAGAPAPVRSEAVQEPL
ncbi:hypothetical protein GCM10009528_03750 [Kineococcus aurantiacus]